MTSAILSDMSAAQQLHGTSIGHLFLIADDGLADIPHDSKVVDLRPFADQLESLVADGSLLSLRLLVPMVPMPDADLAAMKVLIAGPDAEFFAHCARQIGIEQVTTRALKESSTETADGPADAIYQRVFFGCGGKVPSVADLLPSLVMLRPDGQFGLYGLPAKQLAKVQETLSDCGFSMRSAGVDGEFGLLSGSMESLKRLRSKDALV